MEYYDVDVQKFKLECWWEQANLLGKKWDGRYFMKSSRTLEISTMYSYGAFAN